MRGLRQSAAILAFPMVIAVLAGCAAPASRESMTVPIAAAARHHPYTISVETAGGAETDPMYVSNVSNADLKAAIESSIARAGLFKAVIPAKGGDYLLTVTLIRISKPSFGFTFTVDMEAGWSLIKASDKTVVMRKAVTSTHTATFSDSMAGVERFRLAVEGAARENIAQGLRAIGELSLS